jgi:dolichol-phosphate mannosyltransferase
MPTLRLYSVYGAFEEPTRLFPTLVLYGLVDDLPPLVNPDIARDYVWVGDVAEAYLCAATQRNSEPGAVYNVGTGRQTSLREVIETTRIIMNIHAEPQWGTMPDRKWDSDKWVSNPTAIRHALGWQAKTPFEEGLQQMIDWLRTDPDMLAYYQTHRAVPR